MKSVFSRADQRAVSFVAALAVGVSAAGAAAAQEDEAPEGAPDLIPKDVVDTESDEEVEAGWHPTLRVSGNLALGHNKGVVGSPDGTNLTLGYMINGKVDYMDESLQHEWKNKLLWQLGYTRTPAFDTMIKNSDVLDLKSAYLYHIPDLSWLGPFAALRMKSQVFPGYDVPVEEKTVTRLDPDGEREPRYDELGNPIGDRVYDAGDKIKLTEPFAPTSLRETVGLFAVPVDEPEIAVDVRAGFGLWETFVRNGYTVADDEDTPELEVQRMEDSVQLGPEVNLEVDGQLRENVTYGAGVTMMYPIYMNIDSDLEGVELLNAEFDFLLGVKLWEYASLDYNFKAYRVPLVSDAWQIQNTLLLSITLQFV
ncbi:MAG: DUF3078 domain-containing protein [Polyangia bacterium]